MILKCRMCGKEKEHNLEIGISQDGWKTAKVTMFCVDCTEKIWNLQGWDVWLFPEVKSGPLGG